MAFRWHLSQCGDNGLEGMCCTANRTRQGGWRMVPRRSAPVSDLRRCFGGPCRPIPQTMHRDAACAVGAVAESCPDRPHTAYLSSLVVLGAYSCFIALSSARRGFPRSTGKMTYFRQKPAKPFGRQCSTRRSVAFASESANLVAGRVAVPYSRHHFDW